jgi:hypothetical protein
MNVMPWDATPVLYTRTSQFPTISNTNITDIRIYDMGVTLALLVVGTYPCYGNVSRPINFFSFRYDGDKQIRHWS